LSYHELSFLLSNSLAYTISDIVRLVSFLHEFFYSSYHDVESRRINISYLIQFLDKGFAFVLARSLCLLNLVGLGIQTLHIQKSQTPVCSGSQDFHQVISNLVHKAMGTMCRAHSAFKVFDNLDQDLTQFIEIWIFHRCDQFLVPWLCSVAHLTRHSKTLLLQGCWLPGPSEYSYFSQIAPS
jgi:hypothetical protein